MKIDNLLACSDRKDCKSNIEYRYLSMHFHEKKPDRKLWFEPLFSMLSQFNHSFSREKSRNFNLHQNQQREEQKKLKKIYHFLKVDPGCYITICGKKIGRLNFAAILYVYIHTCYFSLK